MTSTDWWIFVGTAGAVSACVWNSRRAASGQTFLLTDVE